MCVCVVVFVIFVVVLFVDLRESGWGPLAYTGVGKTTCYTHYSTKGNLQKAGLILAQSLRLHSSLWRHGHSGENVR